VAQLLTAREALVQDSDTTSDKPIVIEAQRGKDGKFLSGKSGNPAGRPPTLQREIVSIQQEIEYGVRKKVPLNRILKVVEQTIKDAEKGDNKARKLIFEHFIGKPKQQEEVSDKQTGIVIRIENATFKASQEETTPAIEAEYTTVSDGNLATEVKSDG
jgi:hypothetical protein